MPKKYHRPPATKRRKKKKASPPRVFEPLPEADTDHSTAVVEDVAPDDVDDVDDDYGDAAYDDEEVIEQPVGEARETRRTSVQHLVTDYRYVVSELRLSVGLAVFLVVALVITAILR